MNEAIMYGALVFACLCLLVIAIGAALTGAYVAMLYDLFQRPHTERKLL